MRNYLFMLLALLAFARPASGQQRDSTTVRSVTGSDNAEMRDLMMVLGVEKHHLEFNDPKLAGKKFHLTYQEYKQGVAQPVVDLTGPAQAAFVFDPDGRFGFDVFARQVDKNTIEAFFKFSKMGVKQTFTVDEKEARQYSFRTDIVDYKAGKAQVPVGSKFVFLVHTLPFVSENMQYYCKIGQSKLPLREWYNQFKIKHFIAYELTLE